MRTLHDIKQDLDAATERRSELWKELSLAGADAGRSAELAALNERIEELWQEARLAKTRVRFGDRDEIIARARAEDRLDRELAKVA
jgi:hypothetical protein